MYLFCYTSELILFPGWKIVKNKFSRDNKEYQYLQTIKKDSVISYIKITSNVTVKGNKMHYTEAKLVQLLEEKGIGRPSTFSSLVDKIQERGYVKKEDIKGKEVICNDFELKNGEIHEIESKREFGNEKGKLVIQQIGIIVMEFLDKYFNNIFNYEYTSLMEQAFDKIAKGELIWFEVCSICNNELDKLLEEVKNETKIEFQIDENNTYIIGKYGPVIKCIEQKNGKDAITFKPVKKDLDIKKIENGEYKLDEIIQFNTDINQFNTDINQVNTDINQVNTDINQFNTDINQFNTDINQFNTDINQVNTDINQVNTNINQVNTDINQVNTNINSQYILGQYEGKNLFLRKGKFGLYVTWGENSKTLKELGNRPIENITFNEVKKILEKGSNIIREINSSLSIRKGIKGDYIFYKNSKIKKPIFYDIKKFTPETGEDYKICDITIIKLWIEEKYNIR
jgi:DNA topoisomerase-1